MFKFIDIHQANVLGLGAEKFASGLIRHLESVKTIKIKNIYINKKSPVKAFHKSASNILFIEYFLGNLSRLTEIFFWRSFRDQKNEILVLGDLPLNTSAKQYVLCHQSLIFKKFSVFSTNFFRFMLFRIIYKIFLKKNDVVLVQSQEMAKNIREKINQNINVRVIDLSSRFFGWPQFIRKNRKIANKDLNKIKLLYPSAFYPHKNHYLLDEVDFGDSTEIIVTIDEDNLSKNHNSIIFMGNISRDEVFGLYQKVDALLFLSANESLGLPVLEAVRCNLPIVCPYAEYSKDLDSENCFYFDLDDPISIITAIESLKIKILNGWWPNWDFNSIYKDSDSESLEDIILK